MINVANSSMMCSECGIKRAIFSKNKLNSKHQSKLCSGCAKSKLTNYLNAITKSALYVKSNLLNILMCQMK